MNDREMFEFAAKAAGMALEYEAATDRYFYWRNPYDSIRNVQNLKVFWNPLYDDGDNARLEAMLGLNVLWGSRSVRVGHKIIKDGPTSERYQAHGGDRQKARRWASVRAAAEIGRHMK